MSSPGEPRNTELPAVDDRLVAPDTRYEIDDGELVYVPPALEPHAISHGALGALLVAHRAADRNVALDMLTRVSETSDVAPDASIYPSVRDPHTGGRQLEEVAFEILSSERIGHAASKAAKLAARGVRRIFGIDVVHRRAFEWSTALADWAMLAHDAQLEDAALAVALPVAALVDAVEADAAAVRAYRARRHPEFLAERQEGREEGREEGRDEALRTVLRRQLAVKFGALTAADETRITRATSEQLTRCLERVVLAATRAQVFGADP